MEIKLNFTFIATILCLAIVGIAVVGFIMTRLYHRTTKGVALVRTGLGGQKVSKDGGLFCFPFMHNIQLVNLGSLSLPVQRGGAEAMITKDNMRIDVKAEFYVSVSPTLEGISTAAQTLGARTMNAKELSALIEPKFVDALRSVAAQMELRELHEKRSDFVQKVQNVVSEDLSKNGLVLESVSLTGLDQTSLEHFNQNNVFDADGIRRIAESTETRRKERNQIENDNRIAIEEANLAAERRSLEIQRESEFARLEQEREVENRRAAQVAEIATVQAEAERSATMAKISVNEETQRASIQSNQKLEVERIEAERRSEIVKQEKDIAIATKSREQSQAQAEAELARAEAVKASETVKTVVAVEQAERQKKVAIVEAEQNAEMEATAIRILADAELAAADAKAEATKRLADARSIELEVEAEGKRKLHEAENTLSPEMANLRVRLEMIKVLPEVIAQMVKPIEKIDSFRVVNFGGMNGSTQGQITGDYTGGNGQGNFSNNLVDSVLKYQLQSPVFNALGKELNLDLSNGLSGILDTALSTASGVSVQNDGIAVDNLKIEDNVISDPYFSAVRQANQPTKKKQQLNG